MPHIARITLFPVKSLPGMDVDRACFTTAGSLRHDRAFDIVDATGAYVTGKSEPAVHRLRAHFSMANDVVHATLPDAPGSPTFRLDPSSASGDLRALAEALTRHFGHPVRLLHEPTSGFPDDTDSPGPTLISSATLNEVASWYPGRSAADMRARFRTNVEVDDCPAFWEDRLYGPPDTPRRLQLGAVHLLGVNPCRRCVVPSRNPRTGDVDPDFQRTFVTRRRETLPAWAPAARFDFFYRLAINTRATADLAGRSISVGDIVEAA